MARQPPTCFQYTNDSGFRSTPARLDALSPYQRDIYLAGGPGVSDDVYQIVVSGEPGWVLEELAAHVADPQASAAGLVGPRPSRFFDAGERNGLSMRAAAVRRTRALLDAGCCPRLALNLTCRYMLADLFPEAVFAAAAADHVQKGAPGVAAGEDVPLEAAARELVTEWWGHLVERASRVVQAAMTEARGFGGGGLNYLDPNSARSADCFSAAVARALARVPEGVFPIVEEYEAEGNTGMAADELRRIAKDLEVRFGYPRPADASCVTPAWWRLEEGGED